MDYKKIRETREQISNLTSRMTILEELQKDTFERIKETQETCNHELIVINKKYENKALEYIQYGKCLVCGKEIMLKPNNFELDEKIFVPKDKIIDVSGEVEVWDVLGDCNKNRIELEAAQIAFDRLMSDTNYTKDCIKSAIVHAINEVKLYNKKK